MLECYSYIYSRFPPKPMTVAKNLPDYWASSCAVHNFALGTQKNAEAFVDFIRVLCKKCTPCAKICIRYAKICIRYAKICTRAEKSES